MPFAVSVRKLLILALNLASTFLTLFTGLRENPLVVFVTGRYDLVRSRLIDGSMNYDIVRPEIFNKSALPDLPYIGQNYRFFSSPRRGIDNLGSNQNLCEQVNALHSPFASQRDVIVYDDFWGKGPRREQLYVHSISAPNCDVLNVNKAWINNYCIPNHGNNESLCHEYILNDFDNLTNFRPILRAYSSVKTPGQAFLRCLGRSPQQFSYLTDLIHYQSYWAGGSFHVELQTSKCNALPLKRTPDWKWMLFRVQNADSFVTVASGSNNSGWFAMLVSFLYGVVTITMITHGVFAAILQSNAVWYLPNALRFKGARRYFRYIFPFMSVATWAPEEGNQVIRFKGSVFMASDVWMNSWLYVGLSIMDALVNLRMTYVMFQMATWILSQKATFSTFLFLCSTLTRLTWIICFFHTVLRWILKISIRGMKSLKFVSPGLRERLEWFVDATSLFISYKIYSMMLFVILYCFLKIHKSTTLMIRAKIPKVPVEGGFPNVDIFWRSEVICDLVVFVPIVLSCGLVFSTFMLMTKYRYVANNGVLHLLQQRYVFVGWDVFVAMEALGIDPYRPMGIDYEHKTALTNCSLGSLLQQLYTSGPSGLVHLAGDYLFEEGGFTRDPVTFHYSIKRAAMMGLYNKTDSSRRYSGAAVTVPASATSPYKRYSVSAAHSIKERATHTGNESEDDRIASQKTGGVHKGVFDRTLRICSEGSVGRILLVDVDEPGKYMRNKTGSMMEYVVRDALSFTAILEIKPLLNNEKKLHIL